MYNEVERKNKMKFCVWKRSKKQDTLQPTGYVPPYIESCRGALDAYALDHLEDFKYCPYCGKLFKME